MRFRRRASLPDTISPEPALRPRPTLALALLVLIPVLISVSSAVLFGRHAGMARGSVFELANLVGPTAQSLLAGGGLTACTEAMGTVGNPICFHAARMPVATAVVALGVRIFGDRYLPVDLFKTLLLLLPVEAAIVLVVHAVGRSPRPLAVWRRGVIYLLLLIPFGMTAFLADVVNMQVEEGYTYSVLALLFAILLFGRVRQRQGLGPPVLFALLADALYLSKSAMLPAAVVLAAVYLWRLRVPRPRLVALTLMLLAPLGWAAWQHHASGRYTLGTSLDGINFHKGNNPEFLGRYPPRAGESLDQYDPGLNRGHSFGDEWSFNDFHQHAAVDFLLAHPDRTAGADLRKIEVIFFSLHKLGSNESGGGMQAIETLGIVLFRLLLFGALLLSGYVLISGRNRVQAAVLLPEGREWRRDRERAAWTFLALVAACVLPYVAGFAYTRHISILIYPSALLCARILLDWPAPVVKAAALAAGC